MKMFLLKAAGLVILYLTVTLAAQCGENELLDRGTCKRCPRCHGGMFQNTTFKRIEDGDGNYLNCYPCDLCPEGTYRTMKSRSETCLVCRLNCTNLNRYDSVPCGGDSEGHCGECKNGYVASIKIANSHCFKDTRSNKSVNDQGSKRRDESVTVKRPSVPSGKDSNSVASWTDTRDDGLLLGIPRKTLYLVLGAVLILVIGLILVYIFYKCKDKLCCCSHKAELSASALSSNSSKAGLTKSRDSLITDGFSGPVNVRSEIEAKSWEELQAMLECCELADEVTEVKQHLYPSHSFALESNKEQMFRKHCFTHTSANISGDKVKQFFASLELAKQDFEPYDELWKKKPIEYPFKEYIYQVLQRWYQKFYEKTDLQQLCNALANNGFAKVAEELSEYHEQFMAGNQSLPH